MPSEHVSQQEFKKGRDKEELVKSGTRVNDMLTGTEDPVMEKLREEKRRAGVKKGNNQDER